MRRIVAAAALAALGSCSAGAEKAAAEQQVAQFHRMFSAARYDAIYEAASPTFRQRTPREQSVGFMAAVHRKLGPVEGAASQGWHVNYGTGGTVVTLRYETRFANGRGAETFVFETSGSGPRLAGYNISSDALVIQ